MNDAELNSYQQHAEAPLSRVLLSLGLIIGVGAFGHGSAAIVIAS